MAKFPDIFYPTFFLFKLNPTYMKRILHFKNITFKFSYNWFKIDIPQQLWPLTANYLAMFKVISTTIQGGITCGAIDERVIINFRNKNVVIARFRDKNVYR